MGIKEVAEQTGTFDILLVLYEKEPRSVTELGRVLHPRSSGTIKAALDLLKKVGLIDIVMSADKSNRKDITLTEKGRKVTEYVYEIKKLLNNH